MKGVPQDKSPASWRYNGFKSSGDLARPKQYLTFMYKPLKVSQYSAKFSGYRHCGSGDIMVLVCQIISQDHVIKGSCNFMGRSQSM